MLKIQLFLENQEVELTDKVSFPLNKSFENLWNPTDIIVEYSKSINIPASVTNNQIMANAYRLDRQFSTGNDAANIGIYLNPLKRIPMKLIYNGSIVLDGYAKYTSSTVTDKRTYYTFNLYGALGDIFQTMMDCVVDENKLTDEQKSEPDGGQKYVIKQLWEDTIIDREFVNNSWQHDNIDFFYTNNPYNCVGMAPAYRGLYDNFESTSAIGLDSRTIFDNNNEVLSVEDALKQWWKYNLTQSGYSIDEAQQRIDAIDYATIVPNGLTEHQMCQFRAYEQKPYIYIHALMKMFQDKCMELTGYSINLDTTWFSPNNPYYANLCYMLDYLSVKGNTLQSSLAFTGYTTQQWTQQWTSSIGKELGAYATYNITDELVINRGNITLKPFTIGIRHIVNKLANHNSKLCSIKLNPNTEVVVNIDITTNGKTTTKYFWGSTGVLGTAPKLESPNKSRYTTDNFIQMVDDTEYDNTTGKLIGTSYITIPSIKIDHYKGDALEIKFTVGINCENIDGYYVSAEYEYNQELYKYISPSLNDSNYIVVFPNTEYEANWRNSTTCALKNLYTKDEPLFKIILQYTKMMGLIWKTDYQNKTIHIMPRSKYFNDYNIVDWSDKVDKSKGLTIEHVSFNSKYVTFNYEDVDGYHYSGYRNKHGVDYGEKKIRTKYSFDNNETKLFKDKIYPSSVSCKSFALVKDLKNWNTLTKLPISTSEINFIDCENDDQKESISINNWYFRCPNKIGTDRSYYITDVSENELEKDTYFWIDETKAMQDGILTSVTTLPQFSPVYKSNINGLNFGCLFNCPLEDYTNDTQIVSANGNYIYDICWSDYIKERYDANNKKVTCYVRLSPMEFEKFNFKTFVLIDNQLFVVNKIFDFDVNNKTTKVELIQVTNINGYTNQKIKFPAVALSDSVLRITPKTDEYGTEGYTTICVKCYPPLERDQLDITYVSRGSDKSDCYVSDFENDGNTTYIEIGYTSDGSYTEEWHLEILGFDDPYIVTIYVN